MVYHVNDHDSWAVSLFLVLIAFIVACIATASISKVQDNSGGAVQAAAFAAMWTVLILIVVSILGTIIMRRVLILFQSFSFTYL